MYAAQVFNLNKLKQGSIVESLVGDWSSDLSNYRKLVRHMEQPERLCSDRLANALLDENQIRDSACHIGF